MALGYCPNRLPVGIELFALYLMFSSSVNENVPVRTCVVLLSLHGCVHVGVNE